MGTLQRVLHPGPALQAFMLVIIILLHVSATGVAADAGWQQGMHQPPCNHPGCAGQQQESREPTHEALGSPAHAHAGSVAAGSPQQQWKEFWASDLAAGIKALQALRAQLTWVKHQQSNRTDEFQHTAGLDLAMADTLHSLAQHTRLGETQAWLREQVTSEVLRMLHTLQHPTDCRAARKLVCDLNSDCGFGCQMHHAVHCLAHAVALNRTLVLKTDPWHYSPNQHGQETWEQLMAPISSCGMQHLQAQDSWPSFDDRHWHVEAPEVFLPTTGSQSTIFEPPAMPPDAQLVVQLFNSRPEQWWVGVLASYVMRPSPQSARRHAEVRRTWGYPAVGVHIRRSDKVSMGRADPHPVASYMAHVERFCDWKLGSGWQTQQLQAHEQQQHRAQETQLQQQGHEHNHHQVQQEKGGLSLPEGDMHLRGPHAQPSAAAAAAVPAPTCTVYLASDDPAVVEEVRQQYKHIHIVTNQVGFETGSVEKRYSLDGLRGIYDDIMLLSSTDLLVMTFSSQIGRLSYELAQANASRSSTDSSSSSSSSIGVPDRSLHYHSVDSLWYYEGMQEHEYCTTHDFTSPSGKAIPAGQHVLCSQASLFTMRDGMVGCNLMNGQRLSPRPTPLPPALLGRCPTVLYTSFPPILPGYMHGPGWGLVEEDGPEGPGTAYSH